MFGISFSELLLVGLVALLVLGPERLPGAARTAGLWVGRLKRSFNSIKQEVEREIGADEIRRQLHNEHMMSLEQEARKIFNPDTLPPVPPVKPAASDDIVTVPAEPALPPAPAESPVGASDPLHAPAEPAPAAPDTPLPPRAP